jgi:hypothetical protein
MRLKRRASYGKLEPLAVNKVSTSNICTRFRCSAKIATNMAVVRC